MNNRLFRCYIIYMHNTPHCSGNNVCHHQKAKLLFVFTYIFIFLTMQRYMKILNFKKKNSDFLTPAEIKMFPNCTGWSNQYQQ